jgi:hypothetical protein
MLADAKALRVGTMNLLMSAFGVTSDIAIGERHVR